MSISAAVIDAMVASGCSAAQIAEAVKADLREQAEKAAERRERNRIGNRARQQKYREKSKARNENNAVMQRDVTLPLSPDKENTPTPPKEINPLPIFPPSPPKGGHSPHEFTDFWNLFPNKVGKAAAEKAFPKARNRASFEAIMAGLHRYVAKTDDRPWCNPATFLNQARWEDAPAQVAPRQARPPPDKPKRTQATMWLDDNEGFFRNEPDTPFTRFLRANSEGDAAGHSDGDGRVVLLASARGGTGR